MKEGALKRRRALWAFVALYAGCGAPVYEAVPSGALGSEETGTPSARQVVDKIDLLFVVDNSPSMLDKQRVLAKAVPDLVDRLINPKCIDGETRGFSDTQPAGPAAPCPAGAAREFDPIDDIHIGVISSSLGGHGSTSCGDPAKVGQDDKAHLLARDAPNLYEDAGFFFWDPSQKKALKGRSAGLADATVLTGAFAEAVKGVGQTGCAFPAPLEAMYRFLIEPNPPASITRDPGATTETPATVAGTDATVLRQRADFLRPDSLVAIVIISGENDCSIVDGALPEGVCDDPVFDENGIATDCKTLRKPWPAESGVRAQFPANYLVAASDKTVKSGTSACKTNPNDPACTSCYYKSPGEDGCGDVPKEDDFVGLRCWNQKQRFGVDMLYPVQKYVQGLSNETGVYDRNGFKSPNPLYKGGKRTRDLVFFAGIVGVPWQDLAKKDASGKPDLKLGYAPPDSATYDRVLGDPSASPPKPPTDILMIEAVESRFKPGATHPVTGEALEDGKWNSVNGTDYESYKQDLMFACVFPLPKDDVDARDCTTPGVCADCQSADAVDNNVRRKDAMATMPLAKDSKNPLCAPPVDATMPSGPGQVGKYDPKQYRAKAYPGTRFLDVMQRFGGNSIPASICAVNVTDESAPDFGYRPAFATIIDRLKERHTPSCSAHQLPVDESGSSPCVIIDGHFRAPDPGQAADFTPDEVAECQKCGDTRRRRKLDPAIAAKLHGEVTNYQCLCEVLQLTGAALDACQGDPLATTTPTGEGGWCYVDPSKGAPKKPELIAGAEKIVAPCGDGDQAHTIRFLDADTQSSSLFVTCVGASSGTTK